MKIVTKEIVPFLPKDRSPVKQSGMRGCWQEAQVLYWQESTIVSTSMRKMDFFSSITAALLFVKIRQVARTQGELGTMLRRLEPLPYSPARFMRAMVYLLFVVGLVT